MISTRWSKANNPALAATYNADLQRHELIYLDANNLYGHAMSQYLPTCGFRILSGDEANSLELEDLSDKSEDEYIYEADLHYPTKLHNQHNDYPLAPDSIVVDSSMYSPTQ